MSVHDACLLLEPVTAPTGAAPGQECAPGSEGFVIYTFGMQVVGLFAIALIACMAAKLGALR